MISEKAKQKRNEYMKNYMREWRKKNPEKQKEITERYWAKQAEKSAKAEG